MGYFARFIVVGSIFTGLGLMGCASQEGLQTDPPFTVSEPSVAYWAGGRESSGSGLRFEARWSPGEADKVMPDSLYFRGKVATVEQVSKDGGKWLVADFPQISPKITDMTMHADGRQEVGNQPPYPLTGTGQFPFELKSDEAVLSYLPEGGNKVNYYKISGITEKPGRIYPARPQR